MHWCIYKSILLFQLFWHCISIYCIFLHSLFYLHFYYSFPIILLFFFFIIFILFFYYFFLFFYYSFFFISLYYSSIIFFYYFFFYYLYIILIRDNCSKVSNITWINGLMQFPSYFEKLSLTLFLGIHNRTSHVIITL